MKLSHSIAAVLATAVVAMPAWALTKDLGQLGSTDAAFGNTFSSNVSSFTDYYTFSIASSGTVSGTSKDAATTYMWLSKDVTLSSLVLKSTDLSTTFGSDLTIATNGSTNTFSFAGLAAGSYKLVVNGSVSGSSSLTASYSGTIKTTASAVAPVASPAPEASDMAMTLLGLGGVGWLVRRRTQKAD